MRTLLLPLLALATLAVAGHAQTMTLDGVTAVQKTGLSTLEFRVEGTPGQMVWAGLDVSPGPSTVFGQTVPFGFSPGWVLTVSDVLDAGGEYVEVSTIPGSSLLVGFKVWVIAAVSDASMPGGVAFTNGGSVEIVTPPPVRELELAGSPLAAAPDFETRATFFAGSAISLGVAPSDEPFLAGKTADLYLVSGKTTAEWALDASLTDVSCDGVDTVHFGEGGVAANTFVVDDGCAAPADLIPIGLGYDLVIDVDRDGQLGPGDYIDGRGAEHGCFVVRDFTEPGPFPVVELNYGSGFSAQNLFYPANAAEIGPLPLVVVSHGNGHNYTWYDHIGFHLASYGYVVMSHANNTGPGVNSAAMTTLTNTDSFLGGLATIAGGALNGLVDVSRMAWIGHSRGGEGVTIAYNNVATGSYAPSNFALSDIKLISSIAPTVFVANSQPGSTPYHLWVGSSDTDVSGCPTFGQVTCLYSLLTRANGQKQSTTIQGAGHDAFHNSGQPLTVATGPDLLTRPETHAIMRGYLLPLVEYHLKGNPAARDFLWRPWDVFHAPSPETPTDAVVNLTFEDDATGPGVHVIDDFQTQTTTGLASSGIPVTMNVSSPMEGRFADGNSDFGFTAGDAFNGFTQAFVSSFADDPRGIVFEWNGTDRFLEYDFGAGGFDASGYARLSFRAAQGPRHPRTVSLDAPLDFQVRVEDAAGAVRVVGVADYASAISEPYARTGCGTGTGWAAEFETVRIALADLARGPDGIDPAAITKITFQFGPSHGSAQGRLGFDHLVFETR
ncbi:MAG: hypothetical protein R3F20_18730 [Planctomycetota bacterium]